jgi:polyisoprenyl-phosphate glycosyltransferase
MNVFQMPQLISIIIPVYNEQGNITLITKTLGNVLDKLPYTFEIIFVDDGSSDNTLQDIKAVAASDSTIFFISFSRNFGHQNALKAGLDMSRGDCVISMDGDLQHPPALIPQLIQKWEEGYDIVYTIRKDDKDLPMMKRKSSRLFYSFLNNLSDIELESGTADFRLVDKRVAALMSNFTEADLFWRGLVKWLGFKQIGIEYKPDERKMGVSKYNLKKMLQFALKGITSFSVKPLRVAIYLGFAFSLLSLLYIPYVLFSEYFGVAVSGWASTIVTIVFFGGLQLMILGIIGTYLGKLFMESKQRPHYIVKEKNI